jgi:redox-sensitive bicupin YhaK (pirin superfamily)
MGNGSVLHYGDVQRMSAGTGVRHSEYNHHRDQLVHFLQIWIQPNQTGIAPSYEEKNFSPESKRGKLALIASGDGRNGSVLIHQDAELYASIMAEGDLLKHEIRPGRLVYVHLIRGAVTANGVHLKAGDALKLSAEALLTLDQAEDAELLVFDLPA